MFSKVSKSALPSVPHFITLLVLLLFGLASEAASPFASQLQVVVKIDVPSRTLQVLNGNYLLHEYPVGVGTNAKLMTPTGRYRVSEMVLDPIWEHPYKAPGASRIANGKNNPLGTRWIGFHDDGGGSYGMHGTNSPSSIGKFVSHGCVRMHNEDVEQLFELVRQGTPVVVTYDRTRLSSENGEIYLEIFPDPYQLKKLTFAALEEEILSLYPTARIDQSGLEEALGEADERYRYPVGVLSGPSGTARYTITMPSR